MISNKFRFSHVSLVLCSVSMLALPACTAVGVATGLGAAGGIAAAQEGGLSRAAKDAQIQIQINNLWFQYDVETFRKLDMTVNQGRVLITGVVQDPEHRVEAVRLAWQPSGVKQVINEIQVADSEGVLGFAKDTWITTQLRTALTFDREILSINYSIDTVQGTVYLMGFAQNREELNRVIEKARTTKGVVGVVSYVKLVGQDMPDNGQNANNYQSTYNDEFMYRNEQGQTAPMDGYNAEYYNNGGAGGAPQPLTGDPNARVRQLEPYTDANGVRAPQVTTGNNAAYPNNVTPVITQNSSSAEIIRGEPLPPPNYNNGWND